jgi:hypothetical protein
LEKQGVSLRPGSKSTIGTSTFIIQKNQLWLDHHSQFKDTSIMAKKSVDMEHITREMKRD